MKFNKNLKEMQKESEQVNEKKRIKFLMGNDKKDRVSTKIQIKKLGLKEKLKKENQLTNE